MGDCSEIIWLYNLDTCKLFFISSNAIAAHSDHLNVLQCSTRNEYLIYDEFKMSNQIDGVLRVPGYLITLGSDNMTA